MLGHRDNGRRRSRAYGNFGNEANIDSHGWGFEWKTVMVAEAVEILCEQRLCSAQFNISVPKSDVVSPESDSVSIDVVSLPDLVIASSYALCQSYLLYFRITFMGKSCMT
ncbi:hypothetical protein L2E82_19005 [Cichorium intybus]|uniref:Uncharacterized protein n=1 Tax=Cichorium intybus TaxID=13427 RepID=A0ACB9FC71_CICIN|nr:hypothetical protein L2E82_19005 [Cichorium intybus]